MVVQVQVRHLIQPQDEGQVIMDQFIPRVTIHNTKRTTDVIAVLSIMCIRTMNHMTTLLRNTAVLTRTKIHLINDLNRNHRIAFRIHLTTILEDPKRDTLHLLNIHLLVQLPGLPPPLMARLPQFSLAMASSSTEPTRVSMDRTSLIPIEPVRPQGGKI